MKTERRQYGVTDSLGMLEEAVHLLRRSPLSTLAAYFVGALPFVLGLLFFLTDMGRSPYASFRLAEESLGMAALYVWMKCWHGVFAHALLADLCAGEAKPWTARRVVRLAVAQSAVQPWGLALLPLAAITGLGYVWSSSFFNNFLTFGGQDDWTIRRAMKESWRQTEFRSRQNLVAMLVLGVIALVVWFNFLQALLVPAELLKSLLGIETFLSREGFNPLNTTFLGITTALTFLALAPVSVAYHTLRCFQGSSVRTGEDIQAELTRAAAARRVASAAVAILLASLPLLMGSGRSRLPRSAATPSPAPVAMPTPAAAPSAPAPLDALSPEAPQANEGHSSEELNRSIDEVLSHPQFSWRMPREKGEVEAAPPRSWLDDVLDSVGRATRRFWDWRNSSDSSDKKKPAPVSSSSDGGSASSGDWTGAVSKVLLVLLIIALVAIVLLAVAAYLRRRQAKPAEAAAEAQATPDLSAEDVSAADLPERGWLDLAREMMSKGDRRLALRALYLASLALLADHGLIRIVRSKSNREYHAELRRRAHALPGVGEAFGANVMYFEDAWYGLHEVTEPVIEDFLANQERIRAIAQA